MQIRCILCIFNKVSLLRMCSAYMQQRLLLRARLKSTKLQASRIWLIPEIQALTHSDMFSGHADMMYSMYIQHGLCVEDVFCIYAAEVPVLSLIKIYKIASQPQLAHT